MRNIMLAGIGAVCAATLATPLAAQSLADRVASTREGSINFHFAARRGLCGDGERFMRLGSSFIGSYSSETRLTRCDLGPVQVRLTVHDGVVDRIETRAGTMRSREGRDLGAVSTADATRFLLSLAANGNGYAGSKAILPAVLADSATVWPALLVIARDTGSRSHATRQEALFWLSRYAAGAVGGQPNNPLVDESDDERDDLKSHAVFVLSQLPHGEGVPALLDIARSNPDAHVRAKALFWLGQSGDPRALALFERLLRS